MVSLSTQQSKNERPTPFDFQPAMYDVRALVTLLTNDKPGPTYSLRLRATERGHFRVFGECRLSRGTRHSWGDPAIYGYDRDTFASGIIAKDERASQKGSRSTDS